MLKNKALLSSFFGFSFLLTSCGETVQVTNNRKFCFDTFYTISYYNEKNVNDDLFDKKLQSMSDVFDKYDEDEDPTFGYHSIYTINNHKDEFVEINEDLYLILNLCKEYEILTLGYFNPLIGKLSDLWKESLKKPAVLDYFSISTELEAIENSSYELKKEGEKYYCKLTGDAELDLGACAKGYSLDALEKLFEENNVKNYIVDAGQSSILLKGKNGNNLFNIGLYGTNSYINISDIFMGTSGTSEQGVTIDGIKYSHIINPFDGTAINNYDYVSVFGDNGFKTDVLSTIFMLLEIDEIKTFEEKFDVKAIAYKDNKFVYVNKNIEVLQHNAQ